MTTVQSQTDKRIRLIDTAMRLAHAHGFRETSLSDIAETAEVPIGNVYYYFKTKGELGEAVVERRLAEFQGFKEEMGHLSSAKERLFAFVDSIERRKDQLARGGCQWVGLCSELRLNGGALAAKSAALLNAPLAWLEEQFQAAGHGRDARGLAVHLFSAFQGTAAVAHGTGDPELVVMEVRRLKEWIAALMKTENVTTS